MIYNLEEYENFIRKILCRVPLCYTKQLEKALCNTYTGLTDDSAMQILYAVQRRGYVVLSSDGFAMTKGVVQHITQQKFNEYYIENENFRLPTVNHLVKKSNIDFDTLDCLWIAIDMLPDSENFILTLAPWNICFDIKASDKTSGKLYQIAKIPKQIEDARCELLRDLPKISFAQFQSIVTRIAVIEDERHAWMVPHIGFTFICKIDKRSSRMYRIIEKREGKDIWSDYNLE